MIFLEENAKQFAEKHKILIDEVQCPKCSYPLNFDKPFIIKHYRGLQVSACSNCGFDSEIFRVVPVSTEKLEIFNHLKELK